MFSRKASHRSPTRLIPAFRSTSSSARSYASSKYLDSVRQRNYFKNQDTVNNLKLSKDTRVIFQGFTGKQATFDAEHSIKYGTNIVGGVRPNKDGEHLGRPVVPSVRAAMEQLRPDASAVYVAAPFAAGAITEAIEAEVPLVVAVAEHIPLHDMLRIQQVLRTQSRTRLVGANTPGMINPHAACRIGFPPIPFFKPGNVAIAAKSGTLSYETVASTTRAGLGQSMAIGIGGDPLPGTDFVDCLSVFEDDPNTEGIILVGELGGYAEEHAAEWIKDYRKRVANPKPIAAVIGGINSPPGRVMGHAGSMSGIGEPTAAEKIEHLKDAGVVVTDHPSKLGEVMKGLLANKQSSGISSTSGSSLGGQRRSLHTLARRLPPHQNPRKLSAAPSARRNISYTNDQSIDLLKKYGVPIADGTAAEGKEYKFAISIDRQDKNLRIIGWDKEGEIAAVPFNLDTAYTSDDSYRQLVRDLLSQVQPEVSSSANSSLIDIFSTLRHVYADCEASEIVFTATEEAGNGNNDGVWMLTSARVDLDNPAFRSAGRQKELHVARRVDLEDADEVAAEKHSIVYIKLGDTSDTNAAMVGTLANGAGLAMNLVDAIAARGGACANFLDTGGKATTETVKASFAALLGDKRVRVVFVNIFGGLTLGDMIARGILLAYRELDISLPVVVRLRGTNEAEGQQLIAESGLPMHAFHDFEDAARKAIELAGGTYRPPE